MAPLSRLESVLPRLLRHASLARAQIAIDQLRSTLADGAASRIVFLVVQQHPGGAGEQQPRELAAAVAIINSGADDSSAGNVPSSDSATLLHAGDLETCTRETREQAMDVLKEALAQQCWQRGVAFIQWATDPEQELSEEIKAWCEGLQFELLATLEYLSGPVPPSDLASREQMDRWHFEVASLDSSPQFDAFSQLVESTYAETLDCPRLAEHRSAAQTLRGYQNSNAYQPAYWYRVTSRQFNHPDAPAAELGCLILADHSPRQSHRQEHAASSDQSSPGKTAHKKAGSDKCTDQTAEQGGVIEVVYMGLVPQARGYGGGRALLDQASKVARQAGADRLILAVDQSNRFARDLYQQAGLRTLMKETVWARSFDWAT